MKLSMKYDVPMICGSDAHYMNDIANYTCIEPIIKKVKLEDEDTTIEIRKIQSETDIQPSYTASWKDDSKIYQISCKMEEEEFIKLIEGIRF